MSKEKLEYDAIRDKSIEGGDVSPLEINKRISELKGLISFDSPTEHLGRNWAESIADAWELFEEMDGDVRVDSIKNTHRQWINPEDKPLNYACQFMFAKYRPEGKDGHVSFANTPSEAICLTWIAWKEGQ